MDLLSYFLIIAALSVRQFYEDESYTIARKLYALSLLVMYLRFLEAFLVHKKLGPTLMMIKEMVFVLFQRNTSLKLILKHVRCYYHSLTFSSKWFIPIHKNYNKAFLSFIFFQLKDLIVFLILAFFVILGVGIYYHANLWPDHQAMWNGKFSNWGIWKILYYPYWQLYGEFNLDVLYGNIHFFAIDLIMFLIHLCF